MVARWVATGATPYDADTSSSCGVDWVATVGYPYDRFGGHGWAATIGGHRMGSHGGLPLRRLCRAWRPIARHHWRLPERCDACPRVKRASQIPALPVGVAPRGYPVDPVPTLASLGDSAYSNGTIATSSRITCRGSPPWLPPASPWLPRASHRYPGYPCLPWLPLSPVATPCIPVATPCIPVATPGSPWLPLAPVASLAPRPPSPHPHH